MNAQQPVALVTGASSGIGQEVAFRLVEAGFQVVGTSRDASGLPGGEGLTFVDLDVSSDASVTAAVLTVTHVPTTLSGGAGERLRRVRRSWLGVALGAGALLGLGLWATLSTRGDRNEAVTAVAAPQASRKPVVGPPGPVAAAPRPRLARVRIESDPPWSRYFCACSLPDWARSGAAMNSAMRERALTAPW